MYIFNGAQRQNNTPERVHWQTIDRYDPWSISAAEYRHRVRCVVAKRAVMLTMWLFVAAMTDGINVQSAASRCDVATEKHNTATTLQTVSCSCVSRQRGTTIITANARCACWCNFHYDYFARRARSLLYNDCAVVRLCFTNMQISNSTVNIKGYNLWNVRRICNTELDSHTRIYASGRLDMRAACELTVQTRWRALILMTKHQPPNPSP